MPPWIENHSKDRLPPRPLLEVRELTVTFPGGHRTAPKRTLDRVSFRLTEGGSLGIAGRSGSGKSTLIRTIAGLTPATGGSIHWKGQPIRDLAIRDRLRQGIRIQMIFQDPNGSLDPRRTLAGSIRDAVRSFSGRRDLSDQEIATHLQSVGLPPDWLHRYPHQLSGGQRQRACIARAIACRPQLLICDEPVSALDVTTQGRIIRLLEALRREHGFSILFVGHDLAVLQVVSNQILVMDDGRVAESGPTRETLLHPRSRIARDLLAASRLGEPGYRHRVQPIDLFKVTPPDYNQDFHGRTVSLLPDTQ